MCSITNKSIQFLKNSQQNDGSFLSLTSPCQDDFSNGVECQSIFSTALILSCLNTISDTGNDDLNNIKDRASAFLLSQKSEHWSFNYWVRESVQSKDMPYPDDLDDTACALSALYGYKKELIDGEVLANFVSMLASLEDAEGGPYRTWLVPPDAKKVWLDIDLVVNSNIGYFLLLHDVQLESIVKLVEHSIDTENYVSPYYPSVYPIIYFISRFYHGEKSKKVIDFLLKKQKNGDWGSPLNTALAILALLNFGFPPEELRGSAEYIVQNMKEDGSWRAEAFYAGINPKQHKGDVNRYYAGSSALTTAFCVEAISRACFSEEKNCESLELPDTDEENKVHKDIIDSAYASLSTLGAELKSHASLCIERTIKNDKNKEIVLLPYFFANALGREIQPEQITIIENLGLANLYGWMAYTIYDDFLDNEGSAQMLSVANVFLREADRIFSKILPDTDFAGFARSIFARIDSANAWEVAHCRVRSGIDASIFEHPIPDFTDVANLSDRSLGHALGPIGVLCSFGCVVDSDECTSVLEGFRHYISAKQIHDDMHDWEEDLLRGQVNSSSAELFSVIKDTYSAPADNEACLEFLRQKFWNETATVLCDRASTHLEQARILFLSAGASQEFCDKILGPLHRATEQTLRERSNAKKFISIYSSRE